MLRNIFFDNITANFLRTNNILESFGMHHVGGWSTRITDSTVTQVDQISPKIWYVCMISTIEPLYLNLIYLQRIEKSLLYG
ncbi:hypothetical protein JTB14_031443 [Gonioctena quinquepunctata]|nr:hypothetical protein JTB14_031443 [Gonioctena quinquepunctata]